MSTLPSVNSVVIQFLVSIRFILGFSMRFWHFIERPMLQLRRRFSVIARQRLGEGPLDLPVGLPLQDRHEVGTAVVIHPLSN